MDVINSILREFGLEITKYLEIFRANTLKPPMQKYFFPNSDYNPLHGMQRKVDNPQVNINTSWPTPLKYLDMLNGDREKHFVSKPEYQHEYLRRKYDAMQIVPMYTQLDPYYKDMIPSQKAEFHGTKLDSREGYYKPRNNTYFESVKMLHLPNKS